MEDLEEKIEARIAELEKQMREFVDNANRQIAAYQAAIGELKAILKPPEEDIQAQTQDE